MSAHVGECVCCEVFILDFFSGRRHLSTSLCMYKMLSRVSHEKVTRFFTCLCLVSLIASIQILGSSSLYFSLSSHDPARCSFPKLAHFVYYKN